MSAAQEHNIQLVIPRHAVASMEDGSGLSPLQHATIHDPAPVRICSAPTGAGKSFAFQRAVVDHGARVLFIVPTRRLADNLARGLCEELERQGRANDIPNRVFVWTSDAAARERAADPQLNIRRRRIEQIRALDGIPSQGVMIVATPESVAHAILKARMHAPGLSRMTIVDALRFDHIVFDEFHTISARGMGLSAAIAKLTASIVGAAKLTFLSATPIGVRATLVDFGVDMSLIVERAETVVTGPPSETRGMRALHGDVRLRFLDAATPCDGLEAHLGEARACLDSGRQLVLIYDRLSVLLADKMRLRDVLKRLGLREGDCLSTNSFDDSVGEDRESFFHVGRDRDPLGYRVLVATSNLELGVTFKAGLMVMDAGHDPASFVQRVGRVARGDEPGAVFVCAPTARTDRDGWLRSLMKNLAVQGRVCPIDRFTEIALEAARSAFSPRRREDPDADRAVFRTMPARAAWCAALFWAAMEVAVERQPGVRETLRDPGLQPSRVRLIHAKLRTVANGGANGRAWREAFLAEALRLRSFAPRVTLCPPNGSKRSIPWNLYAGTPDLLVCPARYRNDRYGGETLEVLLDRPIEAVLPNLKASAVSPTIEALFPHVPAPLPLPERTLVSDWLAHAEGAAAMELRCPERKAAIEAAAQLVRRSGIVPQEPVADAIAAAGIV